MINILWFEYLNSIMDYIYRDNITFVDLMKGFYYKFLHSIYAFLGCFILLFNNNLTHLTFVLLFITMNAFAVVVYQRCPLNEFEEKYTKETLYSTRKKCLKTCINYSCEHEFEYTIEVLLNAWSLVCLKCLLILVLKTFQLKIIDYNNLYSV
jgi:hypothetical protein